MTDAEIRQRYGRFALIDRRGGWALVHVDRPTPGLRGYRLSRFDPFMHVMQNGDSEERVVVFGEERRAVDAPEDEGGERPEAIPATEKSRRVYARVWRDAGAWVRGILCRLFG